MIGIRLSCSLPSGRGWLAQTGAFPGVGTAAGMSALLVLLLPQKPPLARLPHHRLLLTVAGVQLSPPVSAGWVRHADLGGERKGKRAVVGPGHPCALQGDASALPLITEAFRGCSPLGPKLLANPNEAKIRYQKKKIKQQTSKPPSPWGHWLTANTLALVQEQG